MTCGRASGCGRSTPFPQPGEFGYDTWQNGSAEYTGNAAVWSPFSADEELGYVYLPVESATGDYYGGHRPGNNLFANSLVCLDARTGKRIWYQQLVHHDIWDYDLASAPNLIDITVNGRAIKAVAQATKWSYLFVFDRVTGTARVAHRRAAGREGRTRPASGIRRPSPIPPGRSLSIGRVFRNRI